MLDNPHTALKSLYVSCAPKLSYKYFEDIVSVINRNYKLLKVCMGNGVDENVSKRLVENYTIAEALTLPDDAKESSVTTTITGELDIYE